MDPGGWMSGECKKQGFGGVGLALTRGTLIWTMHWVLQGLYVFVRVCTCLHVFVRGFTWFYVVLHCIHTAATELYFPRKNPDAATKSRRLEVRGV